jgi:hypothetical protein
MPMIADSVLDAALAVFDSTATHIHICSSEPATFAAVATASLGNATISVPAPAARAGGGRKVTIPAVSGATVTASGTASHYAIVNQTGSVLLAAAPLSASQAVTLNNSFSLAAFDVGIPGAV